MTVFFAHNFMTFLIHNAYILAGKPVDTVGESMPELLWKPN